MAPSHHLQQQRPQESIPTQQPPATVRAGVGVFVFRSSTTPKFLLGKRNNRNSMGTNTFALTGGHLEVGETFEECAAREVREECGLEVKGIRFVTAVNSLFLKKDRGMSGSNVAVQGQGKGETVVEGHYVTIFMSCVVDVAATLLARGMKGDEQDVEPENLEPHKCEGWEWYSFAEMREMGDKEDVELFLPLNVLMKERPEACTMLENWGQ